MFAIFLTFIPVVFATKCIEDIALHKLRLDWERYFYGRGVSKDLKNSHKRFVKARKYGVVFSKESLLHIVTEMVKSDTEKLYYQGISASELDDHKTALELGKHYESVGEIDLTVYYYKIAAEKKHLDAQMYLIELYKKKHWFYHGFYYADLANNNKLINKKQQETINIFIYSLDKNITKHCTNCFKAEFDNIYYEFYEKKWRYNYYNDGSKVNSLNRHECEKAITNGLRTIGRLKSIDNTPL